MNYTVQPGDTLNSIASRFGVSVQELIRANNLQSPFFLFVGQPLFIPVRPRPPAPGNVERRLDRLDERVDRLEREVRNLNQRVDRLEGRPRPRS